MLVFLDVDNCIAHDEWRRHFIKPADYFGDRYHEYHLASAFDKVGNRHICTRPGSTTVLITAMPEHYRVLRELWLAANCIPYDELLMRRDGDRRNAVMVKRDLFEEHLVLNRATAQDAIAYDDRDDILAMYRSKGATAIKAILGKEHE